MCVGVGGWGGAYLQRPGPEGGVGPSELVRPERIRPGVRRRWEDVRVPGPQVAQRGAQAGEVLLSLPGRGRERGAGEEGVRLLGGEARRCGVDHRRDHGNVRMPGRGVAPGPLV